MGWAGRPLSRAAREFLGRRIEANRQESNIVESGGPIYFCNLASTSFNRECRFFSGDFFSSFLVTENPTFPV
jgi:hypothetical protein